MRRWLADWIFEHVDFWTTQRRRAYRLWVWLDGRAPKRPRRFFRKLQIRAVLDDGTDGDPYLTRWTIVDCRGWSLKFHIFHRGDDDRDLHDHPWSFWTLILRGGYYEHLPSVGASDYDICQYRTTRREWRAPFTILYREAPSPHRVELKPGSEGKVWTLVLTKPKTRRWGFYTICGWIVNNRYARSKAEGC